MSILKCDLPSQYFLRAQRADYIKRIHLNKPLEANMKGFWVRSGQSTTETDTSSKFSPRPCSSTENDRKIMLVTRKIQALI